MATSADHRGGPPPADVKRLLDWLMTSGGDTAAVEIRQSSVRLRSRLQTRPGFRAVWKSRVHQRAWLRRGAGLWPVWLCTGGEVVVMDLTLWGLGLRHNAVVCEWCARVVSVASLL